MAVTNYTDTDFKVASVQSRTDPAGAPLVDVDGEELRLYADLITPGVLAAGDFQIAAGAGLSVDSGSGVVARDVAILDGTQPGQGNYMLRQSLSIVNIPITAADITNPRIDEIYLVVEDDPYDSSGRALPRFAHRAGDAAPAPIAPGPDSAWTAYLLLATVAIPAGSASVSPGNITDGRVRAALRIEITPEDIGAPSDAEFDAHLNDLANPHQVTAAQAGGYLTTETYSDDEVDALLTNKSGTGHDHDGDYSPDPHGHAASQITSGVIDDARLPAASTSDDGIVQLTNSTASTSEVEAATALAVKDAFDKGNHAHPYSADTHDHGRYRFAGGSGQNNITQSEAGPSGGIDGDIHLET